MLKQVQHDSLTHYIFVKELSSLDVATMTPLEALNKLAELKDKLKFLQQEKENLMKVD